MAAEAVAHELDLDLYVVSLPSIVSKYIGETRRTSNGSSPRPRPWRRSSSLTRPTRCSRNAVRSRAPTTGTPTCRAATSCNAWRRSTGWRSRH
ncbi:hypothetical protein [Streptomyces sp. NPDC094147]